MSSLASRCALPSDNVLKTETPLDFSRGFWIGLHSPHPANEPRARSARLLGRRTLAWRTSAAGKRDPFLFRSFAVLLPDSLPQPEARAPIPSSGGNGLLLYSDGGTENRQSRLLRDLARREPRHPAHKVLDPDLLTMVAAQSGQSPALMTTEAFWKAVAQMGGYLARKAR